MLLITPIPFYLYVIGYDIWFYVAHRAFHTRLLYRFHKKHHEKRRPTLDDTFHADTLENTVMWFGILMPIPQPGCPTVSWEPLAGINEMYCPWLVCGV